MRALRLEVATEASEPGAIPTGGPAAPSPATGLPGAQDASQATPGDWREQIPPGLRGDKLWSRHKDLPSVFLSYAEAEKRQGSLLAVPGKDATPEQVAAFREKLGVPKAPSDYPAPPAPEGQALDDARWERWTGHAHKLGLTPEQLTGLATLEAEERAGAQAALNAASKEGLAQLESEWGKATYDKRMTLTSRTLQRLASEANVPMEHVQAALDASGGGDVHPVLLRVLGRLGEVMAEDGYIEGRVMGIPDGQELVAKIREIRAQGKAHPANNPDHPQHDAAAAALSEMYRLAYGTGPPPSKGPQER